MRIPYENRVDRYDVEWKVVEAGDGLEKSFRYAIITIHELWSIGHLIFSKEPLKIEVYISDETDEDKSALVVYDFGMEDRIPTSKKNNWIYNYGGPNEEADPIKVVFSTIKFDLMHAFFHFSGDPNYGHRHWALVGHLNNRATADDSFVEDDFEYEQKQQNDNKLLPKSISDDDEYPSSPQMSMGHGQS